MSDKKQLMKGNEAIAEAAILAGCRFYAGYPITPQNQIPEYMSWRMGEAGGTFIQAESELAAINMVLGASVAGARAMTSSSSPGISLKQEGISYMAGMELPCLIVNMQRGGPGLGNIQGSQADYFQSVKGGGHGDYRLITLSPSTVQEAADLTAEAFYLADKYRNPALLLSDGILGQMIEPVEFRDLKFPVLPAKDYILDGCKGRKPRSLFSLMMAPGALEKHNFKLAEKYKTIESEVRKFEKYKTDDADVLIIANGIIGRISKGSANIAREAGIKCGVFRPISLWPFPYAEIKDACGKAKKVLVVEQNMGQMVEDVRLALMDDSKVSFLGRPGGGCPIPEDIAEKVTEIMK